MAERDSADSVESNVSHFLFRVPPRFDPTTTGAQFPGTPEGQLARLLMQEYLDQLQRQEQIGRLASLIDEFKELAATLRHGAVDELQAVVDAAVPRHRNRSRSDWDTYAGFRLHLCGMETQVRENTDYVTREAIAAVVGCHPRTITRRMDAFGLKQWPPSTWPEHAPSPGRLKTLDGLAPVLAAVLPAIGLLDLLADGRFDMVMNMLRIFGCNVGAYRG